MLTAPRLLPPRQACGIELISCHKSVLKLRNRQHRRACVPGLPLRTGWDLALACQCDDALDMLNCAKTPVGKGVPPPMSAQALEFGGGRFGAARGPATVRSYAEAWTAVLRLWAKVSTCRHASGG